MISHSESVLYSVHLARVYRVYRQHKFDLMGYFSKAKGHEVEGLGFMQEELGERIEGYWPKV